jgi:hypothetical protein
VTRRKPLEIDEFIYPLKLCRKFCEQAIPGSICFVVGPGGCGKTLIFQELKVSAFGAPERWPDGNMPIIGITADNPDRGFFSHKSIMIDFLTELCDPFRTESSDFPAMRISDALRADIQRAVPKLGKVSNSETESRRAFISIAKALGLKAIVVDEANLMCLTQKGRLPTDYLDSLRTLAFKANCCLVLLGTFDLLQLMNYNAPMNRRTLYMQMSRIRCDTEESKASFISFLSYMEKDFELKKGLLLNHFGKVFEASYGIPGEIIGLLERANLIREALGENKLVWSHILQVFPLPQMTEQMRLEADIIEAVFSGSKLSETQQKKLKLRKKADRKAKRFDVKKDG